MPMQSFAVAMHAAASPKALVKRARRRLRATHIFQPKYGEDSNYITESTEEHLLHFSNQIVIVQEIYMALVKDGIIPRRPTQWVKEATDLRSQVRDALKEQQNSENPSLNYEKLKGMCDKIFDHMKDCPVEDVNDKPMAFIAPMHDTQLLASGDDDVQAQDVGKEEASDREGKDTITPRGVQAQHDVEILLVEPKDSSFPNISEVQDEKQYESETIEGDDPKVKVAERINMQVKQTNRQRRKQEKMPMVNSTLRPLLRVLTCAKNPPEQVETSSSYSQESKHHDGRVTRQGQTDDICSRHVDESPELGMIIPILPIGKMSVYEDLRLYILSTSHSQEKVYSNNDFGLHPKMDNYFFSTIKKTVELEPDSQRTLTSGQQPSGTLEASCTNGALLPENLIVNKCGCRSEEMPTAQEWHRAGVVNLIEKHMLLPKEEPDCPNLVILLLQRNSRLTHIPSSFFNHMPALRFLDLSDTRIKTLPSSLFKLTKLQVLLLRSCVCLDSLPAEVKSLINMEVLDLLGTDLSDLPKEIGKLTQLRHLQLSFYQPDHYGSKKAGFQSDLVSSNVISELQALQELSIVVHPKDRHWKRIVKDIIKQVGRLKMLSYLQFYFPSVEALESFTKVWMEQGLRRFKFLVGHNIKPIMSRVPDEVESKYEQYERCLRFVNGNEVPEVMKSILKSTTAFYLDHHLEIQSLSEFEISNSKELKFCVLRECPNIQVMIIGEKSTNSVFPNLKYLGLHYLWKLERIWEDPIPSGSYQALKYLMIGTCEKLVYIASHSILQCLSNLETFIIEDCESLISIVKVDEKVKYDAPLLPRLKELVLCHLPQLVNLGRGLFPSEEIISIHFCPKLIIRPGHSRMEWKKLLGCNICSSAQT